MHYVRCLSYKPTRYWACLLGPGACERGRNNIEKKLSKAVLGEAGCGGSVGKGLACQHEDLSSNPRTWMKKPEMLCILTSTALWGELQSQAGSLSHSLVRQLSWSVNSRFNEKTVSKIRWRVTEEDRLWSSPSTFTSMHICAYIHKHTHCTHTERWGGDSWKAFLRAGPRNAVSGLILILSLIHLFIHSVVSLGNYCISTRRQ